jgi:hypothetical protein
MEILGINRAVRHQPVAQIVQIIGRFGIVVVLGAGTDVVRDLAANILLLLRPQRRFGYVAESRGILRVGLLLIIQQQ